MIDNDILTSLKVYMSKYTLLSDKQLLTADKQQMLDHSYHNVAIWLIAQFTKYNFYHYKQKMIYDLVIDNIPDVVARYDPSYGIPFGAFLLIASKKRMNTAIKQHELHYIATYSIDSMVYDDITDTIEAPYDNIIKCEEQHEYNQIIDTVLNKIERHVDARTSQYIKEIILDWLEGLTYQQIADKHHITKKAVDNIVNNNKQLIKAHILSLPEPDMQLKIHAAEIASTYYHKHKIHAIDKIESHIHRKDAHKYNHIISKLGLSKKEEAIWFEWLDYKELRHIAIKHNIKYNNVMATIRMIKQRIVNQHYFED